MNLNKIYKIRKRAPIGVLRYSADYLIRPESTMDHVGELLALAESAWKDLSEVGINFDLSKLVLKIAYHDFDESVTGDLKRPFKYHDKDVRQGINKVTREMMIESGFSEKLLDIIDHDKDTDTIEGMLLAWLDNLQVVAKLHEEVFMLGNRLMESEYYKTRDLLKTKLVELPINLYDNSDNALYNWMQSQYNSFIN